MLEQLKNRRSIRRYRDQRVDKDKVDTILKAGLLAPSSRGRRPWEFVLVDDKKTLQTLSEARVHGSKFLAQAPLAIVVAADPEKCDVWIEDASIAAIIMQLAAHSLGLGSCWIQIREREAAGGVRAEDFVKQTLSIPDKYKLLCILAIGYPDEVKEPYREEDLAYDKIHSRSF